MSNKPTATIEVMGAPLPERFWAKVEKTDTCWNWTASKWNEKYGRFSFNRVYYVAHRLAYAEVNGPIPDGMEVDHRCHNHGCVNPSHLRLATRKQNMENRAGARADSKSGIRGVTWNKASNKWVAQVGHNYTRFNLGQFVNILDAEAAVIAKRKELYTHNDMDRVVAA